MVKIVEGIKLYQYRPGVREEGYPCTKRKENGYFCKDKDGKTTLPQFGQV